MSMMSVRTAAAWAIASQYASFAITFAGSVILARLYISPEELGLFTIAFSAVMLISFMQEFGAARYISGERDLTPEKIRTAFSISALFALAVALLCLLAAKPIALLYGDPRLEPLTFIVAASYLCIPLAIVPQALCQRKLDYKSNTMIEVGAATANVCVSLALASRGLGAIALAWGAFAQQAARLLVSQWRAGWMLPWPLRFGGSRKVFEIGATNTALTVTGAIVTRTPELVIGAEIGNAATGLFTRATGLAGQLRQLVAGAVGNVFFPAFRQVRDAGDPLGPPYLRVVAAYTGITWPAMAGIAALAGPLVHFLYGEAWMGTVPLLLWVAMAQLCYVSAPLANDLPILFGRMRGLVWRNVADMLASVALLLLFAPFGLLWVAISRVVHGVVWMVIYLPFMREMMDFTWRELLGVYGKSLAATLAAIAPALASYALWRGPAEAGIGQALCGTAAGIVCWFGVLAMLRHPLFAEILGMLSDLRARLSTSAATPPVGGS
jgi:O-antigen/teichoic acid export membrane protein